MHLDLLPTSPLTRGNRALSPTSSEHLDGISSPERKHREAMEYAEEDEPEPMVEQVLEATAAIPNIPVPKSSDGNVRPCQNLSSKRNVDRGP